MAVVRAKAFYWTVLIVGYTWALVQVAAHEPFDALVLFIMCESLRHYRSAVRAEVSSALER